MIQMSLKAMEGLVKHGKDLHINVYPVKNLTLG